MPATLPVRILRGRGRGKIGLVRSLTGLGPYVSKVVVEGVPGVDMKALTDLEAVAESPQLTLDLGRAPAKEAAPSKDGGWRSRSRLYAR